MTEENTAASEKEAADKVAQEAKAADDAKAKADAEAKKTPKDHIIDRITKREEKLKEELEDLKKDKEVLKPGEDGMDEKIAKAVGQRLEISTTVSEFIKKYPSLAEKRKEIEKYAYDPSRQGVPIETRILEAVGVEEFIKLGAKTKAEAERDAEDGKMGGDSAMTETEKTAQQKKTEQYTKKFSALPFMKNAQKAYDEINS